MRAFLGAPAEDRLVQSDPLAAGSLTFALRLPGCLRGTGSNETRVHEYVLTGKSSPCVVVPRHCLIFNMSLIDNSTIDNSRLGRVDLPNERTSGAAFGRRGVEYAPYLTIPFARCRLH